MRTLCLYVSHEYCYNLDFFIKHGIHCHPDIDYYIVLTNSDIKLEVKGATVINLGDQDNDFESWAHVLFDQGALWQQYDYFILLNSNSRGPFLPVWQKEKNWVKLFTEQITDDVKLFGLSIISTAYVKSSLLTLDKGGMQIAIEKDVFTIADEVYLSRCIIEAGYNIGSINSSQNPYEAIFIEGETPLCTQATLSAEGFQQKAIFDWRAYILRYDDLWKAGIRTEKAALAHYQTHGKNEGRVAHGDSRSDYFYQINLNPTGYNGLFNQIICLVNAIIIGHYTGRNINVKHFYPNNNSVQGYPIEKVIDLPRLNLLIAELGLRTYVRADNRKFVIRNSVYKTWDINGNELDLLYKLQKEDYFAINPGDPFSYIFMRNVDEELRNLYQSLIDGIKFIKEIELLAESIRFDLNLKEYSAIHLRLEDDIIAVRKSQAPHDLTFGANLYQKYLKAINELLNPAQTVFLATGLGKKPHQYNFVLDKIKDVFPNIVTSCGWRERHPDAPEGREFDAIIDYLLCRGCQSFIGFGGSSLGGSTFSEALFYHCSRNQIPFLDCGYAYAKHESYDITFWKVGHGSLGLNGELGYTEKTTNRVLIEEEEVATISAHAHSIVQIKVKKPIFVRGYCSPTAQAPPTMTFTCSDTIVGMTTHQGEKTTPLSVQPGSYSLEVKAASHFWAHSIWLISEQVYTT